MDNKNQKRGEEISKILSERTVFMLKNINQAIIKTNKPRSMLPDIFSNFFSEMDLPVKIENQWVNANSIPISDNLLYKLYEAAGNYVVFLLLTKI